MLVAKEPKSQEIVDIGHDVPVAENSGAPITEEASQIDQASTQAEPVAVELVNPISTTEEAVKLTETVQSPPAFEEDHEIIVVAENVPHNDDEAKAEITNVRGRLKSIDRAAGSLVKPAVSDFKVASDEEAKVAIHSVRSRLKTTERSLGVTPILEQAPLPQEPVTEAPIAHNIIDDKNVNELIATIATNLNGEEHHQTKFESALEESKKKLKSRSNSVSDKPLSMIAKKHEDHVIHSNPPAKQVVHVAAPAANDDTPIEAVAEEPKAPEGVNRRRSVKEVAASLNSKKPESEISKPHIPESISSGVPVDAEKEYTSIRKGLKSTGKLSTVAQADKTKENSGTDEASVDNSEPKSGLKRKNSIVKDMAAKLDDTIEHEKQASPPESPVITRENISKDAEQECSSIRSALKPTVKLPPAASETPSTTQAPDISPAKIFTSQASKQPTVHHEEFNNIKSSLKPTGKRQEIGHSEKSDTVSHSRQQSFGNAVKRLSVKFDEVSTPKKEEIPSSPSISANPEAEYSAIRSKLKSTGKLGGTDQQHQKIEEKTSISVEHPITKKEEHARKLTSSSTVKQLASKINQQNETAPIGNAKPETKEENYESIRKGLKSTGKLQIETEQGKLSASRTAAELSSPVEVPSIRQRSPTSSSIKSVTPLTSGGGADFEVAKKQLKETGAIQVGQSSPTSPVGHNASQSSVLSSPVALRKAKTTPVPSSPKLSESEIPDYDSVKKVLKSTGKIQAEIGEANQRERELQLRSPIVEVKRLPVTQRGKSSPISSRPMSVVNAPAADLDLLKKSLKTTGKLDSNEDVAAPTKNQEEHSNEELTNLRNGLKSAGHSKRDETSKERRTSVADAVNQMNSNNSSTASPVLLKKTITQGQQPSQKKFEPNSGEIVISDVKEQRRLSVGEQVQQINANNSQTSSPIIQNKLVSPSRIKYEVAAEQSSIDSVVESNLGKTSDDDKFESPALDSIERIIAKSEDSSSDSLAVSASSQKSSNDSPLSPRVATAPFQRRVVVGNTNSSNNSSTSSMTESAAFASKRDYKPLTAEKKSPYGRKRFDELDEDVQTANDQVDLVGKADEQNRRLSGGGETIPLFERRRSNNYDAGSNPGLSNESAGTAKVESQSRYQQSSVDAAPLFQRRRSNYDEKFDTSASVPNEQAPNKAPETPQRRKSILKKKQLLDGDSDTESKVPSRSRASTTGKEFTPIAIQKQATQETASAFNSNEDVEQSQLPSPPPRKASASSSPEHTRRNSVKEVAVNDDAQLYLVKGRKKMVLQRVPLELHSIDLSNCFLLDLPADPSAQAKTTTRTLFICSGLYSSKVRFNKTIELANLMKDHDYATKASVVIVDLSTVKYRNISAEEMYFWKYLINGNGTPLREVTKNEIVEKVDKVPKYAPNDSSLEEVTEYDDPKLFRYVK